MLNWLNNLQVNAQNWARPSIQQPRYIALLVKAIFKPTMETQEAIKTYWDTFNKVYRP